MKKVLYCIISLSLIFQSCSQVPKEAGEIEKLKLISLDPGHFHAALIQKSKLESIDSNVYVYAPEGQEVEAYSSLIESYNSREDHPTSWNQHVYLGNDYLERMLEEKPGEIVVLAGNNLKKSDYISQSIQAGLHVLSDKPMAISMEDFKSLEQSFKAAEENGVLLYDIMTERYNIYSILQRELIHNKDIFGEFQSGSLENPAVIKSSVHHFYKEVSGSPLRRPAWYYDVRQEGEGLVDVTTHFVDLVQWQIYPEQVLDYRSDMSMLHATRWPTLITREQFEKSTGAKTFPSYLSDDIRDDTLRVYANGEMNYKLKDIHAKIIVEWNFEAPEGSGDTHVSMIRGTKSMISIKQGAEQGFKPKIYIEPSDKDSFTEDELVELQSGFQEIGGKYPGVSFRENGNGFELVIPDDQIEGHEDHFSRVAETFFGYLKDGNIPDWELSNMLIKYYTTTLALQEAETLR